MLKYILIILERMYFTNNNVILHPNCNIINMEKTKLSAVVKALRKEYGLTQEDLAMKSGVGLCFVRNLEQGKPTLRMDKVNQLLDLFNYELTATKKQ